MNDMIERWADTLADSFDEMWTSTAEFLPHLVGAILIVVLGFFVAKLARWATIRVGRLARLDMAAEKGRIASALRNGGIETPVSALLGTVAYWLVILGFTLTAAREVGWTVLADSIDSLFAWLPNVFAAVVVLAVFYAAARVVRELVVAGLAQFSVANARQLGSISEMLVMLFGLLLAVQQLGFNMSLLNTNVTIMLAGIMGAVALAFGLGARGVIANLIGGYYVRQMVRMGDELTIDGATGTVSGIGRTAVTIDTEDGTRYVPHHTIIEEGARRNAAA